MATSIMFSGNVFSSEGSATFLHCEVVWLDGGRTKHRSLILETGVVFA